MGVALMNDEPEGMLARIVFAEIAGKNQAIHAYDKMIWTTRTTFLTLVFAGWGLLLSSAAEDLIEGAGSDPVAKVAPLLIAMVTVSIGLAVAGFMVDLNYVQRKFRVIAALNGLMKVVVEHDEVELKNRELVSKEFEAFLRVSGDSASLDYLGEPGYEPAWRVSAIIYSVPLVGIALAVALLVFMAPPM